MAWIAICQSAAALRRSASPVIRARAAASRVDQPQLGATELRHAEHVAQQLDPEDDAADPDRDELHGRSPISDIGQG